MYTLICILYAFDAHEVKMSCYKIWPAKTLHILGLNELTHLGLVMPYSDIDLGKHWLR